jgi:hypothetical protein
MHDRHSTRRPRRRALEATIICVLVASGSVVGHAGHPASADPEDFGGLNWLRQPGADSLRVEGSEALVTFTDYSDEDNGYGIRVYERSDPSRSVVGDPRDGVEVGAVPGTRRSATRTVGPVPEGVALCAQVQARLFRIEAPLGPIAPQVENKSSGWSNEVCADPADPASDVALQNIRGNASPQAAQSPAYLIVVDNPGGADAKGVVVDVSTSGVATLGDQAAVAAGWTANGFNCAPGAASGGQTSALRCTGGNVKKGGSVNPAVIVRFTGPGLGAIHAQVSGAGDTTPGNNGTALNLQAA